MVNEKKSGLTAIGAVSSIGGFAYQVAQYGIIPGAGAVGLDQAFDLNALDGVASAIGIALATIGAAALASRATVEWLDSNFLHHFLDHLDKPMLIAAAPRKFFSGNGNMEYGELKVVAINRQFEEYLGVRHENSKRIKDFIAALLNNIAAKSREEKKQAQERKILELESCFTNLKNGCCAQLADIEIELARTTGKHYAKWLLLFSLYRHPYLGARILIRAIPPRELSRA